MAITFLEDSVFESSSGLVAENVKHFRYEMFICNFKLSLSVLNQFGTSMQDSRLCAAFFMWEIIYHAVPQTRFERGKNI